SLVTVRLLMDRPQSTPSRFLFRPESKRWNRKAQLPTWCNTLREVVPMDPRCPQTSSLVRFAPGGARFHCAFVRLLRDRLRPYSWVYQRMARPSSNGDVPVAVENGERRLLTARVKRVV